jgi:hypothetical protein
MIEVKSHAQKSRELELWQNGLYGLKRYGVVVVGRLRSEEHLVKLFARVTFSKCEHLLECATNVHISDEPTQET